MLRTINLALRRLGIRSRRRLLVLISTTFVFGIFIALHSHSLTGNVRKGNKRATHGAAKTHSSLEGDSLLIHQSYKARHVTLKLRTKSTAKPDDLVINTYTKKRFNKLRAKVNIDKEHAGNNRHRNHKRLPQIRKKGKTVPIVQKALLNKHYLRNSETPKTHHHPVSHFTEGYHSIYSKRMQSGKRSTPVDIQVWLKKSNVDHYDAKSRNVALDVFFTASPPVFHGVSPEDLALYRRHPKTFKCLHAEKRIPISAVNDNYCDCEDGTDEPGTSACTNGRFYCLEETRYIPSSNVNDGLCDCCDGSDEWNKDFVDHLLKAGKPVIPYAPCKNICSADHS